MARLNVLVLHKMGDPRCRREAVRALEYMIPECRPDLNCVVHDANLPFPEYLKEVEYHLIVLGPTFLCDRHNKLELEKTFSNYKFIKESSACKIALPQDDYDSSAILDDWMVDWSIDKVYTVCPEHWDILYPKYSRLSTGTIVLGYTGYITDEWINSWSNPKEHSLRHIDVSYRTHSESINRCYLRNLKYIIAHRFVEAVRYSNVNINMDISNDIKDLIPGDYWHRFLEDSKFCLTTPSGSSVLDPVGDIKRTILVFCANNPKASFTDVVNSILKGIDKKYTFTAISPRNIEAALAETVQIGTLGSYSGLMLPNQHYILLNEDCSNIQDVLAMMYDSKLVSNMRRDCKESMLSEPRLRRQVIVSEIVQFAETIISSRNLRISNHKDVDRLFDKYNNEIGLIAYKYWKKRNIEDNIRKLAIKFGAKRVKKLLFPVNK